MPRSEAEAKVRGAPRIPGTTSWDATQALLNKSIAAEWLDLEKHVAWHGAYILDGVLCLRKEEEWLVILKAHRNGRRVASFVIGRTLAEVQELVGEFASRGVLTWQPDKKPPK